MHFSESANRIYFSHLTSPPYEQGLPESLIKLKIEKGGTQEQLAGIMGTNKSNISRL